MTDTTTRNRLRVAAMIQAAEEAKQEAASGKQDFMAGGLTQKAVLLDLIHLTESADKTSFGFKKANSKISWERLTRLRNHGLVHDYAEVDMEDVWRFVQEELPRIRRQLDKVNFPERDET